MTSIPREPSGSPDAPGEDRSAWAKAGELVSPGVWRIPLPMPTDFLVAVNVYLIQSPTGLTLIDGGWAIDEAWHELVRVVGELGFSITDIDRVFVTHAHGDHYSQAVTIRRATGATVYLGDGEQGSMQWYSDAASKSYENYYPLLTRHGAEELVASIEALAAADRDVSLWEAPDAWISGRTVFDLGDRELVAVPTPGHTRGHFVFVDERAGLLFSGDHVLPYITPSLGFEPEPPDDALRQYMDSLRAIRALPDMTLLPAHGPVTSSTHQRVDALLAHHEDRLTASLMALRSGASTAFEVANDLTWTRRAKPFDALDAQAQMLSTTETLAHLNLLVDRGLAERRENAGRVGYRACG